MEGFKCSDKILFVWIKSWGYRWLQVLAATAAKLLVISHILCWFSVMSKVPVTPSNPILDSSMPELSPPLYQSLSWTSLALCSLSNMTDFRGYPRLDSASSCHDFGYSCKCLKVEAPPSVPPLLLLFLSKSCVTSSGFYCACT